MIQSDNAPTLCPRCTHFMKKHGMPGCDIGNYGIEGGRAETIREWLRRQSEESSWTYLGECPSFTYNGSDPQFMSKSDQRALRKLLRI